MITFIIVLGSVRGFIVLHTSIPAHFVYNTVALLIVILSIYGYIKRSYFKNPELLSLKKLLKINMILGVVNIFIDLLLGIPFSPSIVYAYLLPYVIFLLLRVPSSYLKVAFIIVTIAISYSVLDNFIESLKGPVGYRNVFEYNAKLRPDTFEDLSRSADLYRASGFTGNYHDSANILGMMGTFFLVSYLIGGRWLDLGLSLFSLICLTLTQSATNIAVAIFTCAIFVLYVLFSRRKPMGIIYFLIMISIIAWLYAHIGGVLTLFSAKFASETSKDGMLNQLNLNSIVSSIPFFFIGHAKAFGSNIVDVEIAHLKTVYQLGIFHAVILSWILIYPILCFIKVRKVCTNALPAVAAICFGFMSLLHYGSLLRSTSVLLFYAIYTICLTDIINCNKSLRLRRMADNGANTHLDIKGDGGVPPSQPTFIKQN